MITLTAKRFFDPDELLKQTRGIAFVIKFNNCVEKFFRPRLAAYGFRLVNYRRKNRRFFILESENCFSPGAQISEAIAEIRSQGHARSPDFRRSGCFLPPTGILPAPH